MLKEKWYWVSILFCLLLVGCTGNNSPTTNLEQLDISALDMEDQLRKENAILEDQVKQLQRRPTETFMMDLRENMNISFKILHAMENNDYAYLESVSASGLSIDKVENQVVYMYGSQEVRLDFLKGIQLDNLEYWGSGYLEDEAGFQLIFAHYFEETHGTIYIDFIREDGRWVCNGIITNA
ncbi:hypothetical protein ACP8HI_11570 [Paenibacillus sp. FA6]|uniref:hypothetical protein n=1 Tax=Paenibacillus sp. FA6 TaxID=3413029 RepID=UPI003F65B054